MSCLTLSAPAEHLLEVKHSRFLARAAPVAEVEAALAFLGAVADPAATHNCWAYRIGSRYRFNDDGEPAGTGGRPILAAIDGQGVDAVMVVVTRWYGGIKLGAGGLARAYGGAASECLRRAGRVARVVWDELSLSFPFDCIGQVHALLSQHGGFKLEEHFHPGGVTLQVRVPAAATTALQAHLRDATRDRVRLARRGHLDAADPDRP